jgi:hypothetical protein
MAEPEDTGGAADTEIIRPRRSIFKDPATVGGILLALIGIGAYYFYFILKAPVPGAGELARFSAVEGEVKVKASGKDSWVPGTMAAKLYTGDVIQTAPRAGAEISFQATNNLVRIRPDSVVLLGEPAGASAGSKAAWKVESGRVNFEVGQQTEISSPNVRTVAMVGAQGNIDINEGGDTGIRIFKGVAQVQTSQGDKLTLNENEGLRVDKSGKAGIKLALPGAPSAVAPPAQAQLPYAKPPGATTTLTWKGVNGGDTYRVAMDYNVTQANLLLSAALDAPGLKDTTHELNGLDPGKYFWRVAAVNKEGFEGAFSNVSSFAVVKPVATPTPPPTDDGPALSMDPVDALEGALQVRGRTKPGATVSVDGITVKVQADGSFSEFVKRSARTEVVVKATGPDGQVTEQKLNIARD